MLEGPRATKGWKDRWRRFCTRKAGEGCEKQIAGGS
jgi:hypothetical protein